MNLVVNYYWHLFCPGVWLIFFLPVDNHLWQTFWLGVAFVPTPHPLCWILPNITVLSLAAKTLFMEQMNLLKYIWNLIISNVCTYIHFYLKEATQLLSNSVRITLTRKTWKAFFQKRVAVGEEHWWWTNESPMFCLGQVNHNTLTRHTGCTTCFSPPWEVHKWIITWLLKYLNFLTLWNLNVLKDTLSHKHTQSWTKWYKYFNNADSTLSLPFKQF